MKKKFILIIRQSFSVGGLLIALISVTFSTPAQSLFNRSVAFNSNVNDILVISDEKRLFLTPDGSIMKCDLDGNLIWQKTQGGIKPDRTTTLYGLVELDTTIFACGFTDVKGKSAAVLMHYSQVGTLLDYHIYQLKDGSVPALIPSLITRTDDNHLIMCGSGGSGKVGSTLMWLRASINGENVHLWITTPHYTKLWPVKLLPMNNENGEVVLACHGNINSKVEGRRPRLLGIDSNGVIIWQKKFDVGYNASLEDIIHLKKGGYVMIGNGSYGGNYNNYILKTNEDLEVQWMKSGKFHFADTSLIHPQFNAVLEKENHHLLIGGSQLEGEAENYALLAETDSNGNLIEARLDSNGNVFNKLSAMPHGYTLIAGHNQHSQLCFSTLDSAGNYSCKLSPADLIWYNDSLPLVKNGDVEFRDADFTSDNSIDLWQDTVSNLVYDECTDITDVTPDPTADINFLVFPNPTSGYITIEAHLQREESLTLKVFDVVGKLVHAENEGKVAGSYSKQFDLTHLVAGTYLIQLIHDGSIQVMRIMISK